MTIKVKHTSSKIRYPNPTRPKKAKFKDPYRFYVYMWLRSKDSITGKAGTPYYVGKGIENRAYRKGCPVDKANIVIVESKMLEEDAFELEIKLIAQYGRKDNGTGILINMTDGGEGASGYKQTQEHKDKNRMSKIGKKHTPEHTANNIKAISGKNSPLYGKKISAQHKHNMTMSKIGKKRLIIICRHCGFAGGNAGITHYHNDKCKYHIDRIHKLLEETEKLYKIKQIKSIKLELDKIRSIIIFQKLILHLSLGYIN